jgi:hypothetical protein
VTSPSKGQSAAGKPDTLDRDQVILSRLAKIEHKVDSLEQTTAFALRADSERHFAEVKKIFGNSKRRAQVYLAVNGSRSVQEIAAHLSMQRQNVGTDLRLLAEEGMLELTESHGQTDIWSKKPIDRTLRVTRFLSEAFSLGRDGLPTKRDKTKKRK